MLKFKLTKGKGSVNRFVDSDNTVYRPGDTVRICLTVLKEKNG